MEFILSLQSGVDEHKPSLFELLSEQQLSALLAPSIRYLLLLATQRRPRYLLRVLNSFDELYASLMLVVERHFLSTYGGSFTENFYGLKRERVLQIKGGEAPRVQIAVPHILRDILKLRTSDVWKNLAIIVGIPYLKRKLDESYEIHAPQAIVLGPTYGRDILPPDASIRQRILHYYKWFLRNIYPSINAAYYFSLLAFNLAYLFDNTKYSSPFLYLIGTRIRRMGEADHRAIALAAQSPSSTPQIEGRRPALVASILSPRTFAASITPRLLSALKLLLPTSIFALKFLEWWHASDFARQLSRKATEGLDLPPPIISGLPSSTSKSIKFPSPQAKPLASNQTTSHNTVALSSSAPTKTHSPSTPITPLSKPKPPISAPLRLPILTVTVPTAKTSSLCPICLHPIQTPTAAQTGYVFCYTCIFKWVEGRHERQLQFMEGSGGTGEWDEELAAEEGGRVEGQDSDEEEADENEKRQKTENVNRIGEWESGKGRCAVTGRRVLGGTEGLRRIVV